MARLCKVGRSSSGWLTLLFAVGLALGADAGAGCQSKSSSPGGSAGVAPPTTKDGVIKGTLQVVIPEAGTPEIYSGSLPVGLGRQLDVEIGVPPTGTRTLYAHVPGSPYVWANYLANSQGQVTATGEALRIDAKTTAAWLMQVSPLFLTSGELSAPLAKVIWDTPELEEFAQWMESTPTPSWPTNPEFKAHYAATLQAVVERVNEHASEITPPGQQPTGLKPFSYQVYKTVALGSDMNFDMKEEPKGNELILTPKPGGIDGLEFLSLNVLNALVVVGEIDKPLVDLHGADTPDPAPVRAWPFKPGSRQVQLYEPTTMIDFIDLLNALNDKVLEKLTGSVGLDSPEISIPTDRRGAYGVYFFSGGMGGSSSIKNLAWQSFPLEMIRARASNLIKLTVKTMQAFGLSFDDEGIAGEFADAVYDRLAQVPGDVGWESMTWGDFYSIAGDLVQIAVKIAEKHGIKSVLGDTLGYELLASAVDVYEKIAAGTNAYGIGTQVLAYAPFEMETYMVGPWTDCTTSNDCIMGKVCDSTTSKCVNAGCGNGVVEPGEACDANCPGTCDDNYKCTSDTQYGSADKCSLTCTHTTISACKAGDGCCPPTCNAANDNDCSATCGNGVVENGETCDKNCPASCPAASGCTAYVLVGTSQQCTATCKTTPITACGAKDGCCPSACNSSSDPDCNGTITVSSPAGGTTWYQGSTFKTTWSSTGVSAPLRVVALKGVNEESPVIQGAAPATGSESVVVPTSWTPGSDYRICVTGNGGNLAGCSGMFTIAPAPAINISNPTAGVVWKIGATYNAVWDSVSVTAPLRISMYHGGGEVPPIISTTAQVNGSQSITVPKSWSAASGYSLCLAAPAQGIKTCAGPITITAEVPCAGITACNSGDSCCPSGCTKLTDADCPAVCGNGAVEPGEVCDKNCPITCSDGNACTKDSSTGSASSCNLQCSHNSITSCVSLDGCCPAGCNKTTDSDCSATCGNGIVEPGEICDGNCPTSCSDGVPCTKDQLVGSAQTCSASCSFVAITACASGDGCCPSGCTKNNDTDCSATCGNSVVELGESCDGNCPASCNDSDPCTQNVLTGSAQNCSAVCTFPAITQCAGGDGCCPGSCNAAQDNDCTSKCGNGVVEPGEICDGNCPTSCNDSNNCTVDGMTGSAQSCDVQCTHAAITSCQQNDGCCPTGCTHASDGDCPVTIQCGDGVCSGPTESCPSNCGADCCSRFEGFSQTRSCTTLTNGQSTPYSGDVQSLTETNAALDSFKVCVSGGSLVLTQSSSSWPIGNYGSQTYTKFSGLAANASITFYMSFACQGGGHVVAVTGSSGGEKIVNCTGANTVQSVTMPATAAADGTWSATIGLGKASDTVSIDFLAISVP